MILDERGYKFQNVDGFNTIETTYTISYIREIPPLIIWINKEDL